MARPHVIILADTDRREVAEPLEKVRRAIAAHGEIVAELEADGDPLPEDVQCDLAVAIGGDGTIMSQARRLVDRDIPLVGVNFGRFGFLAEFDAQSLAQQADVVFNSHPPSRHYMLLNASVRDAGGHELYGALALNDAVITAGPPFRMIELCLSVDDEAGPVFNGDGVIFSTPAGSTAYNVSAGGPIVHPALEAMIITPLAAHSLAFRPIVMPATSRLHVALSRVNPGTTLVLDGQDSFQLAKDMQVIITRHDRRARLVTNPAASYWQVLLDKMRWAAPPSYRERGP